MMSTSKVFWVLKLSILQFLLLVACSDDEVVSAETLKFTKGTWSVGEGETIQLKFAEVVSPEIELEWTSTDESIFTVDQNGVVLAKKEGSANVIVNLVGKSESASAVVYVYSKALNKIESELSNELVYSKGIYLVRNTVIQCFDIVSDGTIYYDQLGGGLPHVIFVVRGKPNQSYTDYMQLKYFGHGTNMAIEEQGDDAYIWINTNGSKGSDGAYGSNQTFSRLKYTAGGIAEKYAGETYYLPGKTNIHPAIDVENDVLAVTTSGGGDPFRYFYFYKLSEARALNEEQVKLSALTYGGEELGGPMEQTEIRTLNVKNLSKLQYTHSFRVAPTVNKVHVNYYPFQGFDIENGYLYFYEGQGNNNTIESGASLAYVSVFDMEGTLVKYKTKVNAISNLDNLNNYGITNTGYMEAEGIKVKNGTVYLGFASKATDEKRRANILVYQ